MDLTLRGRIMPASNATFLAELDGREVVYKPVAGERPLWDFPDGTLADREVAAYLVSEAFGWNVVPRTWWGEGPHGPGMLQDWQEIDPDQDAVTLVRAGRVPEGWFAVFDGVDDRDRDVTLVHEDTAALRRIAVFDVLVNNADRKGGHVLAMPDGHRYGVDHGVCFHEENKLRTVLWGWADEPLHDDDRVAVRAFAARLDEDDTFVDLLEQLLTADEVTALRRRCRRLLSKGRMPLPSGTWPSIPWPAF